MKYFKIISHRRSGTHFLWETLKSNFDLKKAKSPEGSMGGFKWHRLYKNTPKEFIHNNMCVYLVRDPRDTLTSLWYYWLKGAEASIGMEKFLKNKSFSKYIRCSYENEAINFGIPITFVNPIEHWVDYTEWANQVYTIRFEDLKNDLVVTLNKFADNFGIEPLHSDYKIINNLVGHFPRKGILGDWRNLFSKEDEEYIIEKAATTMLKFNYK